MADVTPTVGAGAQIIQAYTPRGFRVSGQEYLGAVLLLNDKVLPLDAPALAELQLPHFEPLRGQDVSYLIIGAAKARLLDAALMRGLKDMGITAEIMELGAACRTYNVLRAEGRQMAAVLIPGGAPPEKQLG